MKKVTGHDHNNNYITTQELNKLTLENFPSRLAQANLASKNNVAYFAKNTDFDNEIKKFN